ncbi:MAG: murein biosynthesis integral membrane protein MurJ [Alphaproteobacteria bacterium]|nr:murein biosynthesis integral membrane protein MurJ [Alphaproteobacteria bacterium]
MSLMRAVATVGGFTLVSRVLGFVRDMLMAAALGAGLGADAFFVAFKLPNFFRRLFAEGAFNAAFVPLYAEAATKGGAAAARAFAEQALAALLATLLAFTLAAQLGMPWLMHLLAPGFAADPPKFALTIELTIITFPYLLFVSLVSLQGGVLNASGRFAAVAIAPILLNLCLIAALLALPTDEASKGRMLAWAVFAAGALQFLFLNRVGAGAVFPLDLKIPGLSPEVKRLLILAAPAAIGAGVAQINLVVDIILASFLPPGSVSYLFYADRLNELPIGVIGVAVGTALLPTLARRIAAGETAEAHAVQNRAIEAVLLFALPAGAALMVLADEVIRTLFERGAFGPAETRATAAALVAYSMGLPGYVLVKALAPGFFARQDTATPVKIAIACVLLNLALNLVLMGPLLHVGLALSTAIASTVNAALLGWVLTRRGHLAPDARLKRRAAGIVAATAAMALAVWLAAGALAPRLVGSQIERWSALGLLVVLGVVVYAGAAQLFVATDWRELRRLLRRPGV